MTDLIEKLKEIATRANDTDAPIIERAIDRIKELEAELTGHKEDTTDWRASVENQMRRRRDDKGLWSRDRGRRYRLKSYGHPRKVSYVSAIAADFQILIGDFLKSCRGNCRVRLRNSANNGHSIILAILILYASWEFIIGEELASYKPGRKSTTSK